MEAIRPVASGKAQNGLQVNKSLVKGKWGLGRAVTEAASSVAFVTSTNCDKASLNLEVEETRTLQLVPNGHAGPGLAVTHEGVGGKGHVVAGNGWKTVCEDSAWNGKKVGKNSANLGHSSRTTQVMFRTF